jgi:hypothetical protein
LNLDGGGSTTFVVAGRVVNRPSGGRERPVADALLVVRKPPAKPVPETIEPVDPPRLTADEIRSRLGGLELVEAPRPRLRRPAAPVAAASVLVGLMGAAFWRRRPRHTSH